MTLMRLFEELRALGFDGNHDAVLRYAKAWRKQRGAVTAEAYQFEPRDRTGAGRDDDPQDRSRPASHSRMLVVRAYRQGS
jgi:hypothetical protein